MKVLILGASAKNSIGYRIGVHLQTQGHTIVYASRSGTIGAKCDVTNPRRVHVLFSQIKPNIVIHGAGAYMPDAGIGNLKKWDTIRGHISARGFGALVIANELAAQKTKGPKIFIALGGRELSANPGSSPYTVGNGALIAVVRFLAHHTKIRSAYIDMPVVIGSQMADKFLKGLPRRDIAAAHTSAVHFEAVIAAVDRILRGKVKTGTRIVLGGKNSP